MKFDGPFPKKKNPGQKIAPSKKVTYGKIGEDPKKISEYLDDDFKQNNVAVDDLDKVNLQAQRVIAKFGSSYRMEKALQMAHPFMPKFWRCGSSIYRWTYSKRRNGTGGLIPSDMIEPIMRAARYWGVFLDDSDFMIKLRDKPLSPRQLKHINRMHLKRTAKRMAGEPDDEAKPTMLGNQFAHKDDKKYDKMAEEADQAMVEQAILDEQKAMEEEDA